MIIKGPAGIRYKRTYQQIVGHGSTPHIQKKRLSTPGIKPEPNKIFITEQSRRTIENNQKIKNLENR